MESKKVKIKDVVNLINGYPFKPIDREDIGLNIIRIQNLNNPLAAYNKTNKKIAEKYIVKEGDILISWSASLGVYTWRNEEAYLNQHIYKVEFVTEDLSKDYFRYVIELALEELNHKMHGVGLKHLTKDILENYEFNLPTIEHQNAIIYRLNIIENLIQKRKKTISLLNEYIKAIFFKMFGDPVKNSKNWKKKKLKTLGKVITGNTPPRKNKHFYSENNEGIDWIKSNNILKDEIYNTNSIEKLTDEGADRARIVNRNSILIISITGSKERLGDICLTKEKLAFNQQINAFIPLNNNFYFYFLFKYSKFLFRDLAKNAVKQIISKKALENLDLIDTNKDYQLKFERIAHRINDLGTRLNSDLELLKEIFQSLLYNSFTHSDILEDEISILINDELAIETIVQDVKASEFESLAQYNSSKELLFKILEKTQEKNKEFQFDNFRKGIIQKFDKYKIQLLTNKEFKNEINPA